jgi:hypothetical protein
MFHGSTPFYLRPRAMAEIEVFMMDGFDLKALGRVGL